jgi:signal peptidase I
MAEETKNNENFFKKAWAWNKDRKEKEKQRRLQPMSFGETIISWSKTLIGAIIVVMIINGILIASFVVPTGSMENTVMTGDCLFVNKFIYGPSTPQVIPFLNIPLPYYKTPPISKPKQGDVIVFIYPGNKREVKSKEFLYYLKRCVAVAGDSLQIVDNKVIVNNVEFKLPEHGIVHPDLGVSPFEMRDIYPEGNGFNRKNYGPIRIPKMGDTITLTPMNYQNWDIFIEREGNTFKYDGNTFYVNGNATNKYVVNKNYVFGMGDNRDNSSDSRFWGFIPEENVVGTPLFIWWSWALNDDYGNSLSLVDKIKNIRWSRLLHFIN